MRPDIRLRAGLPADLATLCEIDLDASMLFVRAGLSKVQVMAIDVPTIFSDFDDLWAPFLGGQGPAPTYLASLDGRSQQRLRERVRTSVAAMPGRAIHLNARAWAVKGTR